MRLFLLSLLAIPALAQFHPALDPFPAGSCSVAGAKQCRSDALAIGGAGGCCDAESFCCGSGCAAKGWTCVILPDEKVKICDEKKDCGAEVAINVSGTVTSTTTLSRTTSTAAPTSTKVTTTASAAESTPTEDSGSSAASVQVVIARVVAVAAAAAAVL